MTAWYNEGGTDLESRRCLLVVVLGGRAARGWVGRQEINNEYLFGYVLDLLTVTDTASADNHNRQIFKEGSLVTGHPEVRCVGSSYDRFFFRSRES
jgi:hypothetical protein